MMWYLRLSKQSAYRLYNFSFYNNLDFSFLLSGHFVLQLLIIVYTGEILHKAIQFTALLRSHSCHHCNTSKIAIDILTLQQGSFNLLIRGSVDGHEQKS